MNPIRMNIWGVTHNLKRLKEFEFDERLPAQMTKEEALNLAAYIVAINADEAEWEYARKSIEGGA